MKGSAKHLVGPTLGLALSAAFLLAGYECVRSSTYTLFRLHYGKDALVTAGFFLLPMLLAMIWTHSFLVARFGPTRTFLMTYFLSFVFMGLGYVFYESGFIPAIAVLVVFRKAYIVLLIEQYWSFLNSALKVAQAKKLNGMVLATSSTGGVIGGVWVGSYAHSIGTANIFLVGTLLLLPAMVLLSVFLKKMPAPRVVSESPQKVAGGISEFLKVPLLRRLFCMVVATQILSVCLEWQFQVALNDSGLTPDGQTAFSGHFFGLLNAASFLLQLVAAPIALSAIPLSALHIFLPALHGALLVYATSHATLYPIAIALFTFKAFDYSLFRAGKEILYIPLSFDARYRSKQIIDSFGYRGAEPLTSTLTRALQVLNLAVLNSYFMLAFAALVAWLVSCASIFARRRPATESSVE